MGLKKGRRTEGGRESRRKKGASLHAGKWGPISEEAKGVAGSGVKSPEKGGEERERECHQPSTHQQADRQPGREGDGIWLHQNEHYILCHPDADISLCCRLLRWLFPSTAPNIDWDGYVSTLRPR